MSTMQTTGSRRSSWITFSAVVLFSFAGLRAISGIAFLADSRKISDLTDGLFGDDVFWWGIWDLAIAVLALFAALNLLRENSFFGRVVGYTFAVLAIVQGFLVIGYAPWWGAATIALASLVIYGLATTEEG